MATGLQPAATFTLNKESIIKTWRSKSYTLKLSTRRQLIITLRRFRTQKSKRAKSYSQLVLPTIGGEAREIAFCFKVKKARKKRSDPKKQLAKSKKQAAKRNKPKKQERIPFRSNIVRPGVVIATVLMIVGMSGVGWFGSQIAQGHKLEPLKTYSSSTPAKEAKAITPLPKSEPTHVSVPSVGIDAPVSAVGQAEDGTIQTPPVEDWITGWYKYSPTPGEKGPAVIVGHVDSYKGISVFWHLREIQQGDIINVTRADGKVVKFKVQSLKQFDQNNFPTKEVYGNIGYPGLRLITCSGSFSKDTASYSQNTVVYAFMIN